MSTDKLVELITKAIAFKYPKDGTRPGLTISLLNNNVYYVSIVRHNVEGKTKVVAYKTQSPSLEFSLRDIAKQLVADVEPKNPLEVLAQSISTTDSKSTKTKITSTDFFPDFNQNEEEEIFPAYEATWSRKGVL